MQTGIDNLEGQYSDQSIYCKSLVHTITAITHNINMEQDLPHQNPIAPNQTHILLFHSISS